MATRIPEFYPGLLEVLQEFKQRGGAVAVVSQSDTRVIERDYLHHAQRRGFMPDVVLGWDNDKCKRKPHAWPVLEVMRRLDLCRADVAVLDDLKPGVLMARAAGVPVIGAGWGHDIREIREYMEEQCQYYCATVDDLRRLVLT